MSPPQLTGVLDDCFCDVESIDVFNNFKIYPLLQKLTERDYFRYYRVRAALCHAQAASLPRDIRQLVHNEPLIVRR